MRIPFATLQAEDPIKGNNLIYESCRGKYSAISTFPAGECDD